MESNETSYRIYAGGSIIHQDDFDEYDNRQPYYDDYREITIPDELIDFIVGEKPSSNSNAVALPVPELG